MYVFDIMILMGTATHTSTHTTTHNAELFDASKIRSATHTAYLIL